jgi:hypothetical protein
MWRYISNASGRPNHGSIVAPNGAIYYLLETQAGDTLIAVLPNGQLLWSIKPGTYGADTGLRLSPDGQEIFVKNVVIEAQDGSPVDLTLPTQDNPTQSNQAHLLVGADGKTYLLAGHVVIQWTQTSQGFNMVQSANWDYRGAGMSQTSGLPVDAGVTPQGNIWLFYSGYYGGTSVYWLDPTGKILGAFSASFDQNTRLVAIDGKDDAYICGIGFSSTQGGGITMCEAYRQNGSDPVWHYEFNPSADGILGAAAAPGRLYVITNDGMLTVFEDSGSASSTPTATP